MLRKNRFFASIAALFCGASFLPHASSAGYIRFFAKPDESAGGGGEPPKKPKGTLEEQLTAARGEVETAQGQITSLTKERDDLAAENTRLQSQFDVATKAATDAQNELKTTKETLSTITGERDQAQKDLTAANANVGRLETLCGVKGIDPKAAIPVAPEPAKNEKDVYAQWQSLKKTDSVKAQIFYREHRAELDSYGESQSAN